MQTQQAQSTFRRQRSPRMSRMDFHRHDPCRTPSWRWQLAEAIANNRSPLREDEHKEIGDAVRLLRSIDKPRAAVTGSLHPLAAAREIHTHAGVVRHEIEARLVARQPVEALARAAGVPAEVVVAYTHYFFDLPPDGAGGDWMLLQVLHLGDWLTRDPTEFEVWKFIAMSGGLIVLELIIADFFNRPSSNPQLRHVLAERARLFARDHASVMRSARPSSAWFDDTANFIDGHGNGPERAELRLRLRMVAGPLTPRNPRKNNKLKPRHTSKAAGTVVPAKPEFVAL